MHSHGVHCDSWQNGELLVFLSPLLCSPELCELSGRAIFFITRSSHSSYVDKDCDLLALCDPMQTMNCEVDSLPESCFDSGLSTLRDSNEYDSEVEYRHQRAPQRSRDMQEGHTTCRRALGVMLQT